MKKAGLADVHSEQKQTNWILWVNTIFTIITGLATVAISVIQLMK